MISRCRVVLVRPHYPGNLGAVARVMHNFGLSDLCLVAPIAHPADPEARRMSTHGEFILNASRQVPDLGEAVADCSLVVGTSANDAGVERQTSASGPDVVMPILAGALATGPAALVFGPEPSGLTNEEISRCHWLMTIPTNRAYPALNLAQAAAIALYELHGQIGVPPKSSEPPATFAEQERMFKHLRESLERIHFLFGPKADSLMHAVRHLIGRAQPTAAEVKILHGLARQLDYLSRGETPDHTPGLT